MISLTELINYLAYPIWFIKKKYIIHENDFCVKKFNQKLIIISENRKGRISGGSKTEDDHFEILNKIKIKNSEKIIIIYGFNALLFYFFKLKNNTRKSIVLYYTHDLYYKRIENKFIRSFHKFLHYRLINLNVGSILHCDPREINEIRASVYCEVHWIQARIIKKKIVPKYISDLNVSLLFIGSEEHRLNIKYLNKFINEIFPLLNHIYVGLKLNIVGIRRDLINNVKSENIIFHGIISDEELDAVMNNSNIGISPVPIFSGVNVKCLDYLFNGLKIICDDSASNSLMYIEDKFIAKYASNKNQWVEEIANFIKLDLTNYDYSVYNNVIQKYYSEEYFIKILNDVLCSSVEKR